MKTAAGGRDGRTRNRVLGAGFVLGVALSSLGGCSDDSPRNSSPGEATGGTAGTDAGDGEGGECTDEFFAAASKLLDLDIRYRGAGPGASERECALVPEETSCFRTCGRSVLAGAEESFLAELAALDAEVCPAIVECALEPWRSPVRCPEMLPTCTGGCGEVCAGECAFRPLRASQRGCECPTFGDDLPFWKPEPCCLPDDTCGAGSPEFFGGACFPLATSEAIESNDCPNEQVVVSEDPEGAAPTETTLLGCCLPSGECGLGLSVPLTSFPYFGIGCVERSAVGAAAQQACTTERELWPVFEPIPCTAAP